MDSIHRVCIRNIREGPWAGAGGWLLGTESKGRTSEEKQLWQCLDQFRVPCAGYLTRRVINRMDLKTNAFCNNGIRGLTSPRGALFVETWVAMEGAAWFHRADHDGLWNRAGGWTQTKGAREGLAWDIGNLQFHYRLLLYQGRAEWKVPVFSRNKG